MEIWGNGDSKSSDFESVIFSLFILKLLGVFVKKKKVESFMIG